MRFLAGTRPLPSVRYVSHTTKVSTNKSGGWTLNLGGGQERRFTTKTEAVQFGARERRQRPRPVIKGRNGRIQAERTYGADPRRSEG